MVIILIELDVLCMSLQFWAKLGQSSRSRLPVEFYLDNLKTHLRVKKTCTSIEDM